MSKSENRNRLHIHTSVATKYYVYDGEKKEEVTEREYQAYLQNCRDQQTKRDQFKQFIEIIENSAHVAEKGAGRGRVEFESGSANGIHYTRTNTQTETVGGKGFSDIKTAKGKDRTTLLSADYSRSYGQSNPSSVIRRLGNIISTWLLGGSKDSEDIYGRDGKRVTIDGETFAARGEGRKADRIRKGSYSEAANVVNSIPGAELTEDSYYGGYEVERQLAKDYPANNPHIHVSGGPNHVRTTFSHDDRPAFLHDLADQMPGKDYSEKLHNAGSSVIDMVDGKVTRVTSANNGGKTLTDRYIEAKNNPQF